MELRQLHPWPRTAAQALALQRDLAGKIRLHPPPREFRLIGAADVSTAWRGSTLWAAVILVRLPTFELVEDACAELPAEFPYIPGLLSFREIPVLLECFRNLTHRPDVILCDGQGLAHPRRFGLACHLGLWLDLPTIGCAKSILVGDHDLLGPELGDWQPLRFQNEEVGAVLRSRARSRPIIVSPGHLMNLENALAIIRACLRRARLPEPLRLAHLAANRCRLKRCGASQKGSGNM